MSDVALPSNAMPVVPRRRFATAVVVLFALIVIAAAICAIVAPPDGQTRSDGWRFVGRLHPALVHLPIGLIVLVPILEVCGIPRRFRHLHATAGFVLWLATFTTLVAVALGYTLGRSDGNQGEGVTNHMIAGLATAALAVLALALRLRSVPATPRATTTTIVVRRRPLATIGYAITLVLLLGAVTIAGHLGGQLTYGEAYFSEVAPRAIARFLGPIDGDRAPAPPVAKSSPMPTTASAPPDHAADGPAGTTEPATLPEPSVAPTTAPVVVAPIGPVTFAGDVAPMFAESCVSCHGPAKVKGELRLDTYELAMKGGESGPAIVAGDSVGSDLFNRMTLPLTDDDVMPPAKARRRPTAAQVEAVKRWIADGAKS